MKVWHAAPVHESTAWTSTLILVTLQVGKLQFGEDVVPYILGEVHRVESEAGEGLGG